MHLPPSSTIRVAMARNPPDAFSDCRRFPTYSQSVACEYPGWCLEVLSMITSAMNVSITEVLTPWKTGEVVWGQLDEKTGNWTGTLGMLQSDQVDTICLMFQKTDAREEDFDFANTVVSVRPTYVVKQNTETYAELAANVFGTFNVQLWLVMISLTLVQAGIVLLVNKCESLLFGRTIWQPGQIVWMMFEFFVDQKNDNEYPDPLSAGGKMTLTIWALCQCVMMSGLYRGLLLSQLLNPREVKPFDNVDQMINLIQESKYTLTTNNLGNWYFDELQRSQGEHYVRLRAAIAENPVVAAATVDEALDLVESGNYIYPIQEDSSAMQFAKKRCNLAFISQGLPEKTAHFIFRKNSSWVKAWNEQIIGTQSFQHRTFRKYFEDGFIIGTKPRCEESINENKKPGKPLDLWSIMGVILVSVVGTIVSFAVLFLERILHWRHKLKQLKNWATPVLIQTTRAMSISHRLLDTPNS